MASSTRVSDWIALAKVRVNTLVVATTAGGFYMASRDPLDLLALATACVGTGLVAGGAAAFNQVSERDVDALMTRTQSRPVAAGRLSVLEGRLVGTVLALVGLGVLVALVNLEAAAVALATLVSYVFCYTPLKRKTSFAAVIGAVPGALPPMVGWAANGGSLTDLGGWSLFLIMFVWQLPHVLAISWMYRDQYRAAGVPVLPVIDQHGGMTGRQALLWAMTLLPISVLPALAGLTTHVYSFGALLLGLMQLGVTAKFAFARTETNARLLFYASIIYLPLLWTIMTVTRQ